MEIDIEKIQLTQHVKERYAERIMEKEDGDVATYVARNQGKIENDIQKMLQYGEVIYTGALKDKNIVNVILNGTWVVLMDVTYKKVITMYKIDFKLGEEFNKNFIKLQLKRINEAKEKFDEVSQYVEKRKEEIKKNIEELTLKENHYRSLVKSCKAQAEGYSILLDESNLVKEEAASDVRATVMDLVCKKEF